MSAIIRYLTHRGFKTVDASYYQLIREWYDWYKNDVDGWHKTNYFNGITNVERDMKSLGMGKVVCETWANLLLNEKVGIELGNEESNERLQEILKDNNFSVKGNQMVELYMALGTGAFVEYIDNDKVRIDYITSDMIYPISWDNRGIKECAFGSRVHNQFGDCIQVQLHLLNNGKYVIENHFIKEITEGFEELPLPDGVAKIVETGSDIPLFQIATPNIVNNVDVKNPMGISVYANAIDCLKEIDTSFDALNVEIETGRRMVFLSSEMFFTDERGNVRNVVGQKEMVLRFIGDVSNPDNKLIHDFSPALRIDQLKEALQFQLNLFSEKCGLGNNIFEFSKSGIKTATEVISEDSDLYRNLKKHELILEHSLRNMIKALAFLGSQVGINLNIDDISIDFDDSIIIDSESVRKEALQEYNAGIIDKVEYFMDVYKMTESQAIELRDRIEERTPSEIEDEGTLGF